MFGSNKPRSRINQKSTVVAKMLKKARAQANMTQQSLADFSGVGLKAIRTLEQGGNHVSLGKLDQLCEFLGLQVVVLPRDNVAASGEVKDA